MVASSASLLRPPVPLRPEVLPAQRGVSKRHQIAVCVERVPAQDILDLLGKLLQALNGLRLIGERAALQLVRDSARQVLGDELLDHAALVVHDPVDAEIEVGAVELEELAQQALEFLAR